MLIGHMVFVFVFLCPVVQEQNNLCCKAGAKMQRKNGHLARVRKGSKAQLISTKKESEQQKERERCFRESKFEVQRKGNY